MTSIQDAAPPVEAVRAPEHFRADIQGLRAFAVLAVVLAHVTGWPSGGFVGVDVFFVISGFLITGLLLRDADAHGRVSLRRFYAKRMRRIAPAAVTVLVATVVAAWFLFNQPRFWSTVWDAVSSLFFVSNWRFAAEGTDYFHATDAVSPLQHFWSLSVEEQFYLVWPGLVAIVFAVVLKASGARASRVVVGVLLAVLTAASFAFALWQSQSAPTVAYFSTLTRVWELGVGGLLAVAVPLLRRLPFALRAIGGWLGLLGVLASFVVIDDTLPFPAPWAALPVVATALIVAAGVGGPQKHLFPLVNPVSRFFGDISYSLYLWHFPVLVFVLLVLPEQTLQVNGIILGLALALSVVSYFLIEQPLHRSPWLQGKARAQDAWLDWRERFGAQFILSSVGAIVIVAVVAVTVVASLKGGGPLQFASGNGPAGSPAAAAPADPSTEGAAPAEPAAPAEVNPEDELQSQLYAAAAATSWPGDLSPSMDSAISENSSRNPARDCFAAGSTPDFGRCTWGDGNAPNHLYLVGDSTALAYAPAFKKLAENSGGQWRVTTIGLYGCRFTQVLVQNDGDGVMDACPQRKQDIADRIAGDSPQLVVVSNAFALGQAADRHPLSTRELVNSTLAEAGAYNAPGRIVYLAPPPLGADLGQCYSKVSSPQDCNMGVDQAWQDFAATTTAALAAAGTGDHFVSSLGFSCAEGWCPPFAGNTPTKYDEVHLTPAFSERIAPSLLWELRAQGLM